MPKQSSLENICILRLSAIGDTCHALAVARRIQDAWPASRLTWIIGKTEAALLGDIANVEFITFDKSGGVREYLKIRKALRHRRFDAMLCMHASLRANALIPLVPAKRKIGFDNARARDHQGLFLNEHVPPLPRAHVLDGMMQFADVIGADPQSLRWDIPLSAEDIAFADSHCGDGQPVLLISPCSSQRLRNFRNWQVDNYVSIAKHAAQRYGCKVIVSGGNTETERDYGAAICAASAGAVNLVGRTTLKELLALMGKAHALLCPDSGPAHMATTVGTPVIGLYATSDPRRTGPYLSQKWLVNAYPEAVRRFLGEEPDEVRFGTRIRDPAAMELISIETVRERIDDIYAK